jgi:Zn-dependent protease with chaperone function
MLLAMALAGCATTARMSLRASTPPEAERTMEALGPLLIGLRYPLTASSPPVLADGCRIGLVVVPSASVNAGARPGTSSPCVRFTLFLTEGALTQLPVSQLRAVLAHELGHVHLGHFQQRQARQAAGGPANWWLFRRAYDRDEEDAADRFAVRLLLGLEDRYPGSCIALALILEALADARGGRAEWLSTHPVPGRRAQRTQAACNGDVDTPLSGVEAR